MRFIGSTIFLAIHIALIIGWFLNIYKLVLTFGVDTVMTVTRIVGIVIPPLGGIAGYLN